MTGCRLTGDWDRAAQGLQSDRMSLALKKAMLRVGFEAEVDVKKGIRDGAPGGKPFARLSSYTVARKGSSKPLIRHGDLMGSVTHQNVDALTVWVGVKKGRANADGSDYADIAAVHEYGCTIKVTPKMRAFLYHEGLHLKKTTTAIRIPKRSFLQATLDGRAFRKKMRQILAAAVQEALRK